MNILLTGYPGWLTNRFLQTRADYATPIESTRALALPVSGTGAHEGELEIVQGDLTRPETIRGIAKNMDVVIHAAGVLHVRRIRDFYVINRDGTQNLLNECIRSGVKRFIYISTNAAQGFCLGRGQELNETDPCHPASHYGKSKYEAEQLVETAYRSGLIETVIIRPAMFYGPPVAPRHIDIFKKVASGRFPVFGTGDYLRSITYIDNLIQGIHLAIQKDQAAGNTYYITDREIPTLNQIIQAMADAMNVQVKIVRLPKIMAHTAAFLDEVLAACDRYWMLPHIVGESCKNIACRITKAEMELGYEPAVGYREGYLHTIRWCQEQNLL